MSSTFQSDARSLPLSDRTADLIVTSPPYWKKRDYGIDGQIGWERTPELYVSALVDCFREWRRVLAGHGSVFLNIGDTYHRKSLAGIPGRVESALVADGWRVRNRVVWTKERGMPEPARDRLASRYEYVIHLVQGDGYFYDLFGYAEAFGNGANPGDVWRFDPERNMGKHLAPFPEELVKRAVMLACPERVCDVCGLPSERILQRTGKLDMDRPQARRAIELAQEARLTDAHIAAIQATGISDVGKATKFQTGTGRNTADVQRLAEEAKAALGGYFREFTMAQRESIGWTDCGHETWRQGVVLDPFMGTATTLRVAESLGRTAIGSDLDNAHTLTDEDSAIASTQAGVVTPRRAAVIPSTRTDPAPHASPSAATATSDSRNRRT